MDLLMVFGITFCIAMVALYCYWMLLRRAKLFNRVSKLREELINKSNIPNTPRQNDEKTKMLLSPFHPIPIKMEA